MNFKIKFVCFVSISHFHYEVKFHRQSRRVSPNTLDSLPTGRQTLPTVFRTDLKSQLITPSAPRKDVYPSANMLEGRKVNVPKQKASFRDQAKPLQDFSFARSLLHQINKGEKNGGKKGFSKLPSVGPLANRFLKCTLLSPQTPPANQPHSF